VTVFSFDLPMRGDAGRVLFGLAGVVVLAWIYLLAGAGIGMEQMDMGGGEIMLIAPEWSPRYAVLVLAMWVIMMIAMMLPSAAPAILRKIRLSQDRPKGIGSFPTALFFTAGYVTVWTAFSVSATFLQWALDRSHLLSEKMAIRSPVMAGSFVIAAGLYQLTPLKRSCLRQCHLSASCLAENQEHPVRQRMRYGTSCLGCCSALMASCSSVG
jgi:predicted metal-binding membrane protein